MVAKIHENFTKDRKNVTNFEVWSTNIKLPKIEITNIDVYQYRGIPVVRGLFSDRIKNMI